MRRDAERMLNLFWMLMTGVFMLLWLFRVGN